MTTGPNLPPTNTEAYSKTHSNNLIINTRFKRE
jgi:hypothetical protein